MSTPFRIQNVLRAVVLTSVALFLVCASVGAQQKAATATAAQGTAAPSDKAKVRGITAFINLDRGQYKEQIADAVKMLKYARTVFESRGFEVQTIRIATQPFPQYTEGLTAAQTVAFFKDLDALAQQEKFIFSTGPAMLNASDSTAQADVLADVLAGTKQIDASVMVAGNDGVRWNAVGAAARVMKKLSESTEHSQGNFHFAALAMVPPLTPFFPAAYHTGFGHQFAVALQSANVVAAAFKDAPDLATAKQRLTEKLGAEAAAAEAQASRIDRETGWAYIGIDLSPAPAGDVSIGAAIENLTSQPVGSSGTLTAAATITAGIKDISTKQTGYSGLMLPILEDKRLAQRWGEGRISMDALLSYSAVCGTGLDTIPLPGDTTVEQLSLMIGDMATLAYKWHKPLSARLLPVAGKSPGDQTEFQDPFLFNTTLQPLGAK
jgi:uncharacterized protein